MRLQIFSDLHADVVPPQQITVSLYINAVVVAGDVCEGAERGFAWLRQIIRRQIPIISVLGNHEYLICSPQGYDTEKRSFGRSLAVEVAS